jgi:hypothetical protein
MIWSFGAAINAERCWTSTLAGLIVGAVISRDLISRDRKG